MKRTLIPGAVRFLIALTLLHEEEERQHKSDKFQAKIRANIPIIQAENRARQEEGDKANWSFIGWTYGSAIALALICHALFGA